MVDVPARFLRYLLVAVRAFLVLSPPKSQPLNPSCQFILHFPAQSAFKVGFLHRVKRIGFPSDFDVPLNLRVTGIDQFHYLRFSIFVLGTRREYPISMFFCFKVFLFNPACSL